MEFENIKNIDFTNELSWKNKIFLTFDIDWCSDEVLAYALEIIEKYDIKVTFFVTHETKFLERMRKNKNIELGVHPNFNPLLNGDFKYGKNIDEVIEYFLAIVPEAISVRSHSMTQSSPILDGFEKYGLKFDCNTFIPFSSNIELKPYKHWTNKLIKVPYFWEDDIHCIYNWKWDVEKFINYEGIKVFDFHPIHVYLNSDSEVQYELYKANKKFTKNMGIGTETMLDDIIKKYLQGSIQIMNLKEYVGSIK